MFNASYSCGSVELCLANKELRLVCHHWL